jgi:hypothetical protein
MWKALALGLAVVGFSGAASAGTWTTRYDKDNCFITSKQWGNSVSIEAYDADNMVITISSGLGDGHFAFINEGEVREFFLGTGDVADIDHAFIRQFSRSESMVHDGYEYSLSGSQAAVIRFYDCLARK